jgi:hypothetical protein
MQMIIRIGQSLAKLYLFFFFFFFFFFLIIIIKLVFFFFFLVNIILHIRIFYKMQPAYRFGEGAGVIEIYLHIHPLYIFNDVMHVS